MIPTYFGGIVLIIGLWFLRRGSLMMLLCAMLAFGIFEASAAVVLPMLSDSSIPPARMMLGFLLLGVLLQVRNQASLVGEALAANTALVVFCVYGLIGALLLPHIFAGQINVVPMRPVGLRSLLDSFPLSFSSQNITTGVYLIGTAMTAVAAYIAARSSADVAVLVKTCVLIATIHATAGLVGVALGGTAWDQVVDLIRNGSYSQVRQLAGGFGRINGFMAEPSAFARFGFVWLTFATELWLRDVSPRRTGPAALFLALTLMLSLSSTAYIALAGYAAILGLRLAAFPAYARAEKVVPLALVALGGAIGVLAMIVFNPALVADLTAILERLTVNKSRSVSGEQRLFWAMQGFEAFRLSWGLGIGAGSFRSSSIATAILGSMGVIGVVSFIVYLLQLFNIPRPDRSDEDFRMRCEVAAAAAWTVTIAMIPAMIIQGSPDPGMEFAALAGASLGLRRHPLAKAKDPEQQTGQKALAPRWGAAPAPKASAVLPSPGWQRSSK